ncbi:hypothetical protein B0T16DRAFT_427553 [Cercophora newfieldiana]|uniref:Heterokaryon incompatibility domain-containing protein n=1 Tax=Cercophora newfieldiana TaxID=92897 RepID=A0AA40CT31_9PEZI|nr:hypothetical protein B0T16DRAFT_427553 [Cercophora newfieldiana]
MRLLNAKTLQLELFPDPFRDRDLFPYVILSHTWETDEVTFDDMRDLGTAKLKLGFSKIQSACKTTIEYGFTHIWIDTCCIDKSLSAELSEAINSMFRWYSCVSICFAFLADFLKGVYPKWLDPLESVPLAKPMSWAASRQTTKVEDEAYSLLGIFDVNMSMIHGEGPRAFFRLQEAILRRTTDLSIFAWTRDSPGDVQRSLLSLQPTSWHVVTSPSPIASSASRTRYASQTEVS